MILEDTVKPKKEMKTPQDLMDSMVSFIKNSFDPKSVVLPMWTIIGDDGGAYIYMTPFINPGDKDNAANVIRNACRLHKATMIGFMSETWLAIPPKDTTKEEAEKIIPSEYPDRKEAIYLTVETISGQSLSGAAIINREVGDGVLEPFVQHPMSMSHGGRFANMFDRTTVH